MKKIYKAHILFTKEKDCFEVYENGYIAVENGKVTGVSKDLAELDSEGAEVIDFGDKLLIPAMNDMHVHAPQVHNQGVAMDLELLPWLQNYTFPEESKYADVEYAERMYRRFLHTQWLFGTMRSVVFGTVHTESTRILMKLYQKAGMGALVGKVAMNRNCPDALCEDVEAAVEGNEQLKPETSHNLNLSAEYAKGRYSLMAMTFYNHVRNKITTGLPYYHADGSQQLYLPYSNMRHCTVCGAELSARARWGLVSGKLSYTFTHESLPKNDDGQVVNNQYLPARRHALTISCQIDKQYSDNYSLHAMLSGRVLSAVDNTEYKDYYNMAAGTTQITYPAYTLWKLSVTQRCWQKLQLTLTVDNLLNYRPTYYYLNAPVTDGTNFMIGVSVDLD
jgi:hypothetical protein